ncbi:hypothetical protein [Streptomyces uncialis]|uniref:hypothetical protein n=1 Tax=Streptomyces uncialis TaxID=1048205 RepID=UPI00386893E6|nr:hypothetical protein OG924_02545 [Streptomyces uncialis]
MPAHPPHPHPHPHPEPVRTAPVRPAAARPAHVRAPRAVAPRDRFAWIAPLTGTLAALPSALLLATTVLFSPMACGSCDAADAARFDDSFAPALFVAMGILALAGGLLVTSWALPWRTSARARRALMAAPAPFLALAAYLVFLELVAWP